VGALVFGVAYLLLCTGCGRQAAGAARPPDVEVAPVVRKDVSLYGEWVATLDGYMNAQIEPEVTGYIVKQDYHEGSFVHRDEVLFEIDPRPFEAALDMAQARLAQARAELGNAELNVKRDVPEAQANAIPQMQLESDTHAMLAAKAAVEAAQASVQQAALNLDFTKVRSLISGIAGIAQVQVGNLVTPTTVLATVSDVNPLKAYFPISGAEYLHIADKIQPDGVDLLSRRAAVPLELILSDGSTFGHTGTFLFADRAVDQQTGTIRIAAAFPNPGNILRPGEYGKVRAVTQIRRGALLVPQRAVTELQGTNQVAVVGPENRVSIRTVRTGEQVGTMWIITSGLKAGERVVAEGTQEVADGALVTPVPFTPGSGSQ
jgi:RND family efflux transporter MFP subunit